MTVRAAALARLAPLALSWIVAVVAGCGGAPSVIRDEQRATPRGVVTIVMFTDFQCPFCRRTHAALEAALADRPGRARVVLRHVPLRMHPDAEGAARAAICTESLPAHEAMIRGLYAASDLGEAANEQLAIGLGADPATYRACIASPGTTKRLASDVAMMDAVGGDGVPLLYVGSMRMDGAQTLRDLAAAIDAESGGAKPSGR
ncbi:MAG: oxidoreductase [Labilithrix sp.]|nr:oxidoreductase [Labilithrix sp.]